jgi:DNA-binding IclR family transcriptional regulator
VPADPVSPFVPLGEHAMVHPRVHLAYSTADTRRRVTAVQAIRHTEQTVTDKGAIESRLAQVAAEGIAHSREEYKKGACAIAVPVFSKNNVVAALGLVIPVERYDDNLERYTRELRAAAAVMSHRLAEGFTQTARQK